MVIKWFIVTLKKTGLDLMPIGTELVLKIDISRKNGTLKKPPKDFLPIVKSSRRFEWRCRWRNKHNTGTSRGWRVWATFSFQRSKGGEIEVWMVSVASRNRGHHFRGGNVLWPQFYHIFGRSVKWPSVPSSNHLKNIQTLYFLSSAAAWFF